LKQNLHEVSRLNHSSRHSIKVSIKNSTGPTTKITCKANIKNIHIRSKLLYRCKNVRTSTKFVLGFLLPTPVLVCLWPCHRHLYFNKGLYQSNASSSNTCEHLHTILLNQCNNFISGKGKYNWKKKNNKNNINENTK